MKPTFTIIIPHKNIPTLLQRCLNSIPRRDDLHVIIVDDNSDRDVVNFATFPGLNDPQCEIFFTKDAKGAGYARNVGLKHADSKWVLFADADDFYSEKLNDFLDKYKETDYQTVYFCNETVDNDTLIPIASELMVEDLLVECKQRGNMDALRYKAYAPWTKMTRLDLIREHNIKYEEIPAANDSLFNVKVGHYATNFDVCKEKVYVRTKRKGSLIHTQTIINLRSRILCGYHVNEFLKPFKKLHEYHSETWGHFMDIRKISWYEFFKTMPEYFYRTPWFILRFHIRECIMNSVKKFRTHNL